MSDLCETLGQDVLKKAGDEGLGCHRGTAAAACADRHRVSVKLDNTVVGDGDAMGVASEIVEEVLGTGKRPLHIDLPLFQVEFREQVFERLSCELEVGGTGELGTVLTFFHSIASSATQTPRDAHAGTPEGWFRVACLSVGAVSLRRHGQ